MISHPSFPIVTHQYAIKDLSWKLVESEDEIDENFIELLSYQNIQLGEFQLINRYNSGTTTKFVCVSVESKPILLFPIQEVWLSKANFPAFRRSFWQRITSLIIDISCVNLLFSGNLLRIDKSYLAYNPNSISELEAYYIHFEVINSLMIRKISAVQLIHMPSSISEQLKSDLEKWGFEQPLPDYEMKLEIKQDWGNWEGYLSSITKKYVARAKKIRESAQELDLKFLSEKEMITLETEIQLLYLQTIQKQDVVLAKASKGYFSALKSIYGNKFQVKGIFKTNKLIAFYSWFEWDDSIEMHFVGVDYQENHNHNLYFNILFEGMLDAIDLNKKFIFYGRTSLDAKASVGAKAILSSSYLRMGNLSSCITETLQNYISQTEKSTWKERNPLKLSA